MNRPKIKIGPINVKPHASHASVNSAWFYENAKSIDVYINLSGRGAVACKIPRRFLADWVKRTEPAP